ncbi:MAG: BON domain-containing protein [Candidatus Omnitrophota bacterium]
MGTTIKRNLMAPVIVLLMIFGCLYGQEDMDKRIESAFKDSYVYKTYLKDEDVRINSKNGMVTLTGTVKDEHYKNLAGDTAEDLPGVKGVDNRIEVKDQAATKSSDARIARDIKDMLMLHRNVTSNAQVEVRDGQVTLRGESGNEAEKQLTAEYVKDVDGVKGVDNQLTIAGESKEPSRSVGEYIDDASIKAQIKAALMFHKGTSAFRTHVSVNRGVVTVTGKAENSAEKELVTKRIENVRGVQKIKNEMTIEPEGKKE